MNTQELLLSHRTIRKYKDTPVNEAVLNRLLKCGLRASNTGNMQMYSIIVTREEPLRSRLCELHFGQGASAPVLLTICVDINRYHLWCRQKGCDEPYRNLLWLMNGTIDASLCAQNICVAAEAEGLGFCFLGTVLYQTRQIADLLDIPDGVMPVITLSLGYPDEMPNQSERLPLEGVCHQEKYHRYTDEDILRVHRVREEFPFNKAMVEQNGVRNLAQLFTEKRYPRKDNENLSEALKNYLEERFFEKK